MLVVDDSAVIRRLVTEVLADDPGIEVVGTANDGRQALERADSLRPDVITLDIEMPNMSGLECLAALRRTHPATSVIMFSTLTERGAAATLDALALGASDYVTKPSNTGSMVEGKRAVRDQLIPRVKALGAPRRPRPATDPGATSGPAPGPGGRPRPGPVPTRPGPSSEAPMPSARPGVRSGSASQPTASSSEVPHPLRRDGNADVVLIGTSTGGPTALGAIWSRLGSSFPAPILIVQHMPPTFTTLLAERLTRAGTVPVAEAVDGEQIVPGRAYLAPGDFHMVVEQTASGARLRLNQDQPVHACRPSVDPLFSSAASAFGRGALAVVLTGMGTDGCEGARAVRLAGGRVIAQDEATSVVWGMPGAVVQAGLADRVLPLDAVAAAICNRTDNQRPAAGRPTPAR